MWVQKKSSLFQKHDKNPPGQGRVRPEQPKGCEAYKGFRVEETTREGLALGPGRHSLSWFHVSPLLILSVWNIIRPACANGFFLWGRKELYFGCWLVGLDRRFWIFCRFEDDLSIRPSIHLQLLIWGQVHIIISILFEMQVHQAFQAIVSCYSNGKAQMWGKDII